MKLVKPIAIQTLIEQYPLEMIADSYHGDITGINEINKVKKGDITFVDTAKYYDKVLQSEASVIIINQKFQCPPHKCLLYSPTPFEVYNQIALDQRPAHLSSHLIDPTAVIDPTSTIAPNVSIGQNVTIGAHCIIYPNVTIYPHTIIEDHVIIHANTTIGSDAFYYHRSGAEYHKMHSIGYTHIESNVEIGSSCTIDSGVSGVTRIGRGTKIDNQVHIAHGVEIGQNCLICAQVAIAGKSKIGHNVTLYGKVGVSKGVTIHDNATILASSNVDKNLEGNKKYYGSPAIEAMQAMKYHAAMRMLPQFMTKIREMIKQTESTIIM